MHPGKHRQVLNELRNDDGPAVVEVGVIPPHALSRWPARATNRCVITRQQRAHYLNSHAELAAFEDLVVECLIDPDAVAELLDLAHSAMFYKQQDPLHDIVLVVRISHDPNLANSVITARRQRRSRRGKPRSRTRLIWSRVDEEE